MNGNFRNLNFVKRYKYTYYDLDTPLNAVVPNNARQTEDNYRFTLDNSLEANPIDWYNAYFKVDFKLVTLVDSTAGIIAGVDNANKFWTTTNGQTFFSRIEVNCNGSLTKCGYAHLSISASFKPCPPSARLTGIPWKHHC